MKPSLLVRALVAFVATMIATKIVEADMPYGDVIASIVIFATALGIHAVSRIPTSTSS